MSNNVWIVYVHFNKINKKKYFGITKQSFSRRCRKNGEGYKGCPYFYNAIQKYGWDNFEHIILKEGLTQEEAAGWEQWLIKEYHTMNIQYGYNISPGGDIILNSETISKKNKEKWKQGLYNVIKTPVYCVELEQYFESASEASRKYKLDNSSIQKVCKGLLNYCGVKNGQALHWLYAKDVTEENVKQLKNKKEVLKGISIPVYCIEKNITYKSAEEASKLLGIDASSIRRAANKKANSAGKMHWTSKIELINIGEF